ncbi:uncharacterized protein LOC113763894 [Coffea eugenioides]|uniref:uncharacterized protein LOC113763894 n=1 Tax=Coffea eugenioides TaxID=49369 RepID=UPI000F609792|nr:uncharacterized protein LOC113763894 [Coffea eugenioides]
MDNSGKRQSMNDRKMNDAEDRTDRSNGGSGCSDDSTSTLNASSSVLRPSSSISRGSEVTAEILAEEGGNLLLQQSDRVDNLVQWLRALDVQVIGACRADERLKPLLKLNASTGAAEDRLLAQLTQQFEPSEVGMLARCLCAPLVSVRVGRINKIGGLFCPTATRGNLNLTLLPTSDLRISFIGDDGLLERLVTLTSETQCSAVEIEEILADKSGRSFCVKIPSDEIFYFWCSEKSRLLGIELLRKMKDLLKRKPCLAELTGISESRLESFAIHLRAYLVGPTLTNACGIPAVSLTSSLDTSVETSELNVQSPVGSSKPSRSRQSLGQGSKTSPLYQGSLSPRPSSFKEGVARNLASLRSVSRERLRRRGDSYLSCIDNLAAMPSASGPIASSLNHAEDKLEEATETSLFPPSTRLESVPLREDNVLGSSNQVSSMGSSLSSPLYCWCPPVASTRQCATESLQCSTTSSDLVSLPTLLQVTRSSGLLASKPPLNLADVVPLDFPPLLPEPLVRLPLSIPASQQIPTFTPLMCDPIVHIPVIDVCSSGQGYLVSAGPAISNAIPPMCPNLASPLVPEADSMVEKSARETLRLLINSSNQPNPPLMGVLPSVLTDGSQMENILSVGSRGLYSGTRDIDAITSSVAAIGFVSSSDRFVLKRCIDRDNLEQEMEKADGSCGSSSDDGFPKSRDGRFD